MRGPTLQKIVYEISKSFDFIEITLISSDFTDFKVISLIWNIYNYLIAFLILFYVLAWFGTNGFICEFICQDYLQYANIYQIL